MANIKITDLTAYTDPDSTDVLPIVDVGADVTKKVSVADLLENAGEEGTFTPALYGTGTTGTGTYTFQQGRYTKIGRTVSIDIVLTWTAHTGAGTMFITGLPFAFGVGFGYRAPLAVNTTGFSATVAYGDGAYTNISVPATIATSGTIYINGTYQV